jgi:hypothetical protein
MTGFKLQIGGDAKTECRTSPVMDITHQSKGKHQIHQTGQLHKKYRLEETGNKN